MKAINFLVSLGVLAVMLPSATLASTIPTNSGMQEMEKSFQMDARNYEKQMMNLFTPDTKSRTVVVTGVVNFTTGQLLNVTSKNNKEYTVDATNATIMRYSGAKIALSEISLRDTITVRGTLIDSTITATSVYDISLRANNSQLYGTIVSINQSANNFVIATAKSGEQTVQFASIYNIKQNGEQVNFSDLAVGQRVYVTGSWNSNTKIITVAIVEIVSRSNPIFLQGTVTGQYGDTIMVKRANGITYNVDAGRGLVVGRFYSVINQSDVSTGDVVMVGGIHLNDSTDIQSFLIRDLTR